MMNTVEMPRVVTGLMVMPDTGIDPCLTWVGTEVGG
jgi:hypothetical protein